MKILHVSSGETYGGVETVLASLARHRALCPGLEHHFALCYQGRLSEEIREFGAPLYPLGFARISHPFSARRARKALTRAIASSACDIVIGHGVRSMIIFAPTVRASQRPLVMWVHGLEAGRPLMKMLLRRVPPDLVVFNSRYIRQVFSSLFPSSHAAVIYYPAEMASTRRDDNQRIALRGEFRTSNDATVIVMASRMVSWKGHKLLIDALSDLRKEESWQCWIVGGPQTDSEASYSREIKAKVRSEKLDDRIHFLGQRTDVPQLMAASDIFCQPNESAEPFGMVYIEAMLAELPVVTSALGGAIEVVDQDSGILVPANDRPALSQALSRLLADPALRRQIGAGGPARARALCEPAARLQELQTALEGLLPSDTTPVPNRIFESD
jgi:glycosyltransferase involved in cell wall biosynthesis